MRSKHLNADKIAPKIPKVNGIIRRQIVEPADLTLEQQFQLKVLANHIHGLNQQQLQNLLLKSVQLGMMKDNQIRCYKLYPYNTLNVDISRSEKIVS